MSNNRNNIDEEEIRFPSFEKYLSGNPDYPEGKYMFLQRYRNEVTHFPKGVWFVSFPGAPSPTHRVKVCIQISKSRVVQMSCTCYKKKDCEHTIYGLFCVREKFIDSDDESDDEEEIQVRFREVRSDSNESAGSDSFIDDREESDLYEESVEATSEAGNLDPPEDQEMILQQEFKCQICLEELDVPVLFSCLSHSVCYDCAEGLYENAPRAMDGSRKIKCPTCGDKHFFKIKLAEELKYRINKGLKRMIASYKQEKEFIQKKENALKEEINKYKVMLEKKTTGSHSNEDENPPHVSLRNFSERSSTQDSLRKATDENSSNDVLVKRCPNSQESEHKTFKVFKVQSRKKDSVEYSYEGVDLFAPVERERKILPDIDEDDELQEGLRSKRKARKLMLDDDQ